MTKAIRAGRAYWAIGLILLCGIGPAGAEETRHEFVQTHMGSPFRIVLYTADPAAASTASDAAFARIKTLDAALSDYDPESELMRFCRQAGGPPVPISPDLMAALSASKEMARRSGGAFDPTVAPVVRLWRRARRDRKLPAPDKLAEALVLVGFDRLELDPAKGTARLARPGMKLDLGGVAKGLASAEAVAELARRGVPRSLVAGSGDICVGDPPPGREGWTIAVDPLGNGGPTALSLLLRNVSVSSSGDAEQFVEIDGKRYSHIVDPRTGLGVVDRAGVTVVGVGGALVDAADTAAFVLGPERGLALIEKLGLRAIIVRSTPEGPQTWRTPGFDALPRPPGQAPKPGVGP